MKEKIIWYILYAVILIGIILSIDSIKEEYVQKFDNRIHDLESIIEDQKAADQLFLDNWEIYKNWLLQLLKNQEQMSADIKETNEHLKRLELY
jgi:hypothetical protein